MILIDNLQREASRIEREADVIVNDTHLLLNAVDDVRNMAQHMLTALEAAEACLKHFDQCTADLNLVRSAIAHAKQGYRA